MHKLIVLMQVSNILKYLFPVPKDDSRRVITFANQEDFISFRSVWKELLLLPTSGKLCVFVNYFMKTGLILMKHSNGSKSGKFTDFEQKFGVDVADPHHLLCTTTHFIWSHKTFPWFDQNHFYSIITRLLVSNSALKLGLGIEYRLEPRVTRRFSRNDSKFQTLIPSYDRKGQKTLYVWGLDNQSADCKEAAYKFY